MKNVIRIFLICLVLIGSTGLFAYWSVNRFNTSLNAMRDTCFAIANQPPVLYCDKSKNEQISTTIPEGPAPVPTPDEPSSETAPDGTVPEPTPEATPDESAPVPTPEVIPASATPTPTN